MCMKSSFQLSHVDPCSRVHMLMTERFPLFKLFKILRVPLMKSCAGNRLGPRFPTRAVPMALPIWQRMWAVATEFPRTLRAPGLDMQTTVPALKLLWAASWQHRLAESRRSCIRRANRSHGLSKTPSPVQPATEAVTSAWSRRYTSRLRSRMARLRSLMWSYLWCVHAILKEIWI